MQNVILSVHLILALLMIGVVLLQRSEGGGLGMGGSGGGVGGVMTGRQAANALSKLTWILAAGFLVTSVALTVLAARDSNGNSVTDALSTTQSAPDAAAPALPDVELPPATPDAPVTPPAAE